MTFKHLPLVTLLAMTLAACTPPGQSPSGTSKPFTYSKPHPPAWLQGIWTGKSGDRTEEFKVTADNIVETSTGGYSGTVGMGSSTITTYAGFHKTFQERSTEEVYELVELPEFSTDKSTRSFVLTATDSVSFTYEYKGESGLASRSVSLTRKP